MYLVIFEDGTILQSEKLPVECDESIKASALDVIRFQDGAFEWRNGDIGEWEPCAKE